MNPDDALCFPDKFDWMEAWCRAVAIEGAFMMLRYPELPRADYYDLWQWAIGVKYGLGLASILRIKENYERTTSGNQN